jgi:hypothetical protein
VVCERVKHRARGARVAVLWRDVRGPVACMAGCTCWNDERGFMSRENEVKKENMEVPCKDEDVNKRLGEFSGKRHFCVGVG